MGIGLVHRHELGRSEQFDAGQTGDQFFEDIGAEGHDFFVRRHSPQFVDQGTQFILDKWCERKESCSIITSRTMM